MNRSINGASAPASIPDGVRAPQSPRGGSTQNQRADGNTTKDWGRAKVGVDGNCGFALLGQNLQEGEAEFVEIESWPQATYRQERAAWGKALAKLEARLGSGPLRYEVV